MSVEYPHQSGVEGPEKMGWWALDLIAVGDRLRVRPGEKVAVDGVVLEGRSALDESLVTGESMPVTKGAGDKVIAGTLNQTGAFIMRAEKVGRDTMLARIVQMVAAARRARADPAPSRSGDRMVRAGGHRRCTGRLRGVGDLRARATARHTGSLPR